MESDVASLYAKIQLNQGQQLISVSLPGNSASWSTSLTVQSCFGDPEQHLNRSFAERLTGFSFNEHTPI
jgi:hypothetical protein